MLSTALPISPPNLKGVTTVSRQSCWHHPANKRPGQIPDDQWEAWDQCRVKGVSRSQGPVPLSPVRPQREQCRAGEHAPVSSPAAAVVLWCCWAAVGHSHNTQPRPPRPSLITQQLVAAAWASRMYLEHDTRLGAVNTNSLLLNELWWCCLCNKCITPL